MNSTDKHLQQELQKYEQVEKELKARVRQQAAVAELGQRALVGTNLSILMEEAVSIVTQTLNMEFAKILELLPDGTALILKVGQGWQEGLVGHFTIDVNDDSQIGYTLQTNGPVSVENLEEETRFNDSPLLRKHQIISGLSVIIQGREQLFGILGVYTTSQRSFTEDDVHFLQSIANVLAMAIERKQAETEIVQRNHELLILQSAGAAINSSLDLEYVLNTITEQMTNLLGVEACAISDWNTADGTVTVLTEHGPDGWLEEETEVKIYRLKKYPLTEQVLTEQRIVQMTISQPGIDPAEVAFMQRSQIKMQLMLPMVFQGRVIGLVDVMDSRQERIFSDQQIGLARLLANQAASAIENARLHTEIRRMLKEQLALREASAVISSSLDLETVLSHIAEQLGQAIDVTGAYISDFTPETETSTILAEYFSPEAASLERVSDLGVTYYLRQDFPGALESWQNDDVRIFHHDDPDLPEIKQAHMQKYGCKTMLILPLQVGGQLIGYADLWESRHRRDFTPEEIMLCRDIAQQAAIAIINARLFNQTQLALDETAALFRVTRTLVQIDNEQEMFELVLTEYLQNLNLQQGGVLIFNEDKAVGILKAHMVGGKLVEPGLSISVAGNLSYKRLSDDKNPVIIKDAEGDKPLDSIRELTLDLGIKSMLLVPIVMRGEVIGALGAGVTEISRDFSDREITLVKGMADQLGIAIENIRLQAETEKRAKQFAVLHELDRAITTNLRPSDIYLVFAHHVTRLLSYDRMSITQAEGNNIQVAYVTDKVEDQAILPAGTILPRQTSAMGWVITQKQPLVRHNIPKDIRFFEDEQLVNRGIQASMSIPLRSKGEVIGTWNIYSQQVGTYTPDDLRTAQVMADQLAIAIENARLYSEIQQYLEELTTLNMISQTITSTLDLEEMLAIITQHTVQLAGVAAASVVLYDEDKDKLRFAAASGMHGDAVRGTEIEMGQGIVGWVFEHEEAVLVPDVSKDARFFNKFDQLSDFSTKSVLCVPLQTKGQTIGAIEAMNKAGSEFDQEDLRLLLSLAAPAATAIETARLFKLAQQEIAERKRAEEALEEERALLARRVAERTADLSAANEELARASRLKDEFLASMSHELRTPLTAILGLSEVLKAKVYGPLTDKQEKSLQDIEESGRHLLALINDILDLSKIEAGQLELQVGSVIVESVCQASMQFIKQTAHRKQLKVSLTLDSTVSTLQADERRLKQILVNLLSNAVKFTPEHGSVGLEVTGDTEQQVATFTVWDTGIGISQEDMERLFQPFVQLDSRLSRQHAGTGLGLALVSRMVKLHNGIISVESDVKKGSRFSISFPWSEPTQLAGTTTPTLDAVSSRVIHRILIVDDSPTTAQKLTRYLRQMGITTVVHRQGEGAVEKAIETRPDVIILDIILSDTSGWDILAQLKAESLTQNIPVLVISAMDSRSRGRKLGAAECLVKPILQEELQQTLSRIIIPETESEKHSTLSAAFTEGEESDQSQPLVLVAEDEDNIVTLLVDYLRAKKYQVIVARNGVQAIERAQEEKPDIILMDIQMPEMDGLEAIRYLRSNTNLTTTPIIALTALAMSGDRERCLAAGANDYLSKPVNLKQLVNTIETQLIKNLNPEENSPT